MSMKLDFAKNHLFYGDDDDFSEIDIVKTAYADEISAWNYRSPDSKLCVAGKLITALFAAIAFGVILVLEYKYRPVVNLISVGFVVYLVLELFFGMVIMTMLWRAKYDMSAFSRARNLDGNVWCCVNIEESGAYTLLHDELTEQITERIGVSTLDLSATTFIEVAEVAFFVYMAGGLDKYGMVANYFRIVGTKHQAMIAASYNDGLGWSWNLKQNMRYHASQAAALIIATIEQDVFGFQHAETDNDNPRAHHRHP